MDPSQPSLTSGQILGLVAFTLFLMVMVVLELQNRRNKKDITPKTLGSLSPVVPSASPSAGNSSGWKKSVGDFIREVVADDDEVDDDEEEEAEANMELIKAIESVTNVYGLRCVIEYVSNQDYRLVSQVDEALLKKVLIFKSELEGDDWDNIYGMAKEGSRLERLADNGGEEEAETE